MAYIPRETYRRIPFSLDTLEDIYERARESGDRYRFERDLRDYYVARGMEYKGHLKTKYYETRN
jgi:hypothetical protein